MAEAIPIQIKAINIERARFLMIVISQLVRRTLRLSGSPTHLTKEARSRRVRSKRLLAGRFFIDFMPSLVLIENFI